MKHTIYGVVGYKGKLGSLLVRQPNFVPVECDITDLKSVKNTKTNVDVLVNCAGISSVDVCESNPKLAHKVNIVGADNLMSVYGNKVLNISSDYVFGGWKIFPPTESSSPSPVNVYGMTKMVVENFSISTYGAKIIRLSRSISPTDVDLSQYFHSLLFLEETKVPSFFYRNYMTRQQAVGGIEYFVRNFSTMPNIVNYGSSTPLSFYDLVYALAKYTGLPAYLLRKEKKYDSKLTPRPRKAGFSVKLAKTLGFPIYDVDSVISSF